MDSIEKLLPIIVMLLWVLLTFSVNKKKKKVKSQKPSQKKKKTSNTPSFFDNLQKSVEDILMENQRSVPFPLKTADIKTAEVNPVKKEKASRFENVRKEKSVPSIDDSSKLEMKPGEERPMKIQKISNRDNISVRKLREAIIWSEILAKPLSLRNDDSIEYS